MTSGTGRLRPALRSVLPVGRGLPDDVWNRRHRGILRLLWLHVPVIVVASLLRNGLGRIALEILPVAAAAVVAGRSHGSRGFRSGVATFGLVMCSALLVQLSGGRIELHFHFFVVVGVVTLYQDWVPFGLAIAFVVVEHGVVGVLDPGAVYDHEAARSNPWAWAGIHGAFVLAASVAHVLAWRLNEEQALRDPLTRLPNRVLFVDRLNAALARRARTGGILGLLFIDLDEFKSVNDTLGHNAGDQLLVEVAHRMTGVLRQADTAARFGGDEFAVLLEDGAGQHAVAVAERILTELREPLRLDAREVRARASIGVVVIDGAITAEEALRNADLAMYMAKSGGRGRVEVFEDAVFDRAVDNAELEADLRHAVQTGAIEVNYQPTVLLHDGRITGLEALARWHHPSRGLVPPSVFIPIAESTGVIVELGHHVLRTACRDAVGWRRDNPGLSLAVNVSAHQLVAPTLVADVARVLVETGLEPSALVLEITESALVRDVDAVVARLTELKALGLRLAIDDFGTGYSSLSYLRHFPVDILKIDRSFVDQLPGDGVALARSIVRLGESMGLEVIAEGVEADAQRTELTRLGCLVGQGYLFMPARPEEQIGPLLVRSHEPRWWTAPQQVVPPPRSEAPAATEASTASVTTTG
jgi:diguanylate cyclase (GGDEF)-like protein